ncbi:MAG: ATP-dependent DNA helicase RecG [Syntrophales bacterium]|nr:ATP-dependent DNA helicase RecG [Syntrophales bacterium]
MMMSKCADILEKIEKPLRFSYQSNYSHLALVKELGPLMVSLADGLAATGEISPPLVHRFKNLFVDFDALPLEEKKSRVSEALLLVSEMRTNCSASNEDAIDWEEMLRVLSQPVQYVKGVGPRIASILERKRIHNVEDLLYFLPRRYEDRRQIKKIVETTIGQKETIVGEITAAQFQGYGLKKVFEVTVDDGSGRLLATWFKGSPSFLKATFRPGHRVIFTGEVRAFKGNRSMIHPDFEVISSEDDDSLHFRRIVPIYSESEGLHQKTIRKIIHSALSITSPHLKSPIPEYICKKRDLPALNVSLNMLHFPPHMEVVEEIETGRSAYLRRLIYEEFFFFELGMAVRRKEVAQEKGIRFETGGELVKKFYRLLPFNLTGAQWRVIREIEEDVRKERPMNRLLQGDVGSGKTVVAMAAMVTACDNGYQAAIMAPTEILAEQHFRNIGRWAEGLGLRAALLTGGKKGTEVRQLLKEIEKGEIHIIIGTHALIQDRLSFHNLGLAVIDEQHRFGVLQRAALRYKGVNPHIMVMTATPIPRTLAMTVYGDLDISVIDELPPGKKPIKTQVYYESEREKVYEIIRSTIKKGQQVFIVYPLVEESESLDLRDATNMADHLQNIVFPEFKVGLVHGKMRPRDKDRIMSAFLRKEIDILVATTVIEVGIDVPEASLMVIEHADRFGLSQLHQLRGRVGRSNIPGHCILMAQYDVSDEARRRLAVMEKTNDGFRIAEEDLAIRGPGEFMGTRQWGVPEFRVASIVRDGRILSEARSDAFAIVEDDPFLEKEENKILRKILIHRWGQKLELAKTG